MNLEVFSSDVKDVDNKLGRICGSQDHDVNDSNLNDGPEGAFGQYKSPKGIMSGASNHIIDILSEGHCGHFILRGIRQAIDDKCRIGDENPQQINIIVANIVQKTKVHVEPVL